MCSMSAICSKHVDTNLIAALKTAIAAVNNPDTPNDHRKSHEHSLLAFRQQDAAWSTALFLIDQGESHDLQLFASQTLKFKVNEQGSKLPAEQLQQLLQQVIQQLAKPQLHAQVLHPLCLAVAALVALLPCWSDIVTVVRNQLPQLNGTELLKIIAEEGISDWRHVVVPGPSSSQFDWATATRERFRSWSQPVLQLLLSWLQNCKQMNTASSTLLVKLLSCLVAWVQLGALHQVPEFMSMQVAEAGLLCIQSSDQQELESSLSLLLEIPEYAPEHLLLALQPRMIEVAAAACSAATAPVPDLAHAAAWSKVFAAYTAGLPQLLLQPFEVAGGAVQKALLHLSIMPHIHDGKLVSLPALEVWASLLDRDIALFPTTNSVTGNPASGGKLELEHAHSEGEAIGDPKQLPAAFVRSCLLLLLYTAYNWLQWQQSSQGRDALAAEETIAVVQGILHMACGVLGHEKYIAAMMFVWGARQHQQQQDVQQQQQPASMFTLEALHLPCCAPLLEQADYELMPAWQQQQLSRVLANMALSPAWWRLHAAVLMAASSCAGEGDSAAAAADGGPDSWAGAQLQTCEFKGANELAHLLSAAAASLQQPPSAGVLPEQQQHLALNLCVAVKGWAQLLVELFISPTMPDGATHMSGLLRLLLNFAAQNQAVSGPAAAAVRAVSSAALASGWSQLHLFAPLLMQALQAVMFSGGAEQDLLASLSSCLAAPGLEPELQSLRHSVAEQLLQPAISFLADLQQQLQAGHTWASLANMADSQICHHLVRVRAVLEGRLLLQQRWQKEQQQQQQLVHALEACAIHHSCEEIHQSFHTMHVHDARAAATASGLAMQPAAAAMDEDGLAGTVASLHESSSSPGPGVRQVQTGAQQHTHMHQHGVEVTQRGTTGGNAAVLAAAAVTAGDPALQLLLSQMWPQLHILVTQHNASGRFLQHYSKCCSRLIKIHPVLLAPQLQQFLQITVVSIAQQGGCTLAEPFAAAIEACCMQGSSLLLEYGPEIVQALSELWSVQELAALQQPGGGDAVPDLAEQVLKLYCSFAKHGKVVHYHSAAAGILQQATAAAASCATCCHRKVGSTALSLLSAVLAAAVCEGPQQQQLLDVVCRQGVAIAEGAVGALLAPSPLPRVQKVATVLLDLAASVDQIYHSGGGNAVAAAVQDAAQRIWQQGQQLQQQQQLQHQCQFVHSWLLQGALKYAPTCILEAEAAALAADCATILCGSNVKGGGGIGSRQTQQASRSFLLSRKLKKRLRDFAEKHMRTAADAGFLRAVEACRREAS